MGSSLIFTSLIHFGYSIREYPNLILFTCRCSVFPASVSEDAFFLLYSLAFFTVV